MKYSSDMFLPSDSGYGFPYALAKGETVSVVLGYGKQINPMTGEEFFHQGIDLSVKHKPLLALADGMITGVAENETHGHTVVTRYGNYFVTYGHVSETLKGYGEKVTAGETIATSGDFLHFGVRFKGEFIDPNEFLDLIAANINQLELIGMTPKENLGNPVLNVKTEYDKDEKGISMLIIRFFTSYMTELRNGTYKPSQAFEQNLRTLFSESASQNYFYEKMPTVANPLGLTSRAEPLATKAEDMLLTDFLHYVAVRHHVFVPGWSDEQKKKLFRKAMVQTT